MHAASRAAIEGVVMVPIFTGHVDTAGTLVLDAPYDYARHKGTLRGKPVEVVLRAKRRQRSLKQNNAYWGLIVPAIAEHCGYTKDEAHEALGFRFLRVGEPDAVLPARRSTADLTVQEFQDYCEAVKVFAAETLGIFIPDPESVEL
jgi:hypothetical protein